MRFTADLTPKECIQQGIFGGCYFNPEGGKPGIYGRRVDIDHREFPKDWFENLPRNMYVSRRYDKLVNKYKVVAGKDQAFWEMKGWMDPEDPRGWFQWYCRYYQGRRIPHIDERQIARWKGVKSRWGSNLAHKIYNKYGKDATKAQINDVSVSPVVRQTLLHWACDMNVKEYKQWLKRNNLT